MEYMYDEIESTRESVMKEADRLDVFMEQVIGSLSIGSEQKQTILSLLCPQKDNWVYNNIDDTNMKILYGFDRILKNPHDDGATTAFIETIKNTGLMSLAYQKYNKLFLIIQYLFYGYRQFEDEELGLLPFNIGKTGGSLFFVMKYRKSRATLQKVLDHIRNDGHIASLDYVSWRDRYCSDGVRVDQCISQKLYSDYTQEGNVMFSDSFGASYFGNYDSVIENEKDCILLDTIGGRIYICGNKLTSKEIHSQNTTIDMMKILLENIGKEVSNSKLPVSTYSQNKNEILGKVVLPIKKLSKEHF